MNVNGICNRVRGWDLRDESLGIKDFRLAMEKKFLRWITCVFSTFFQHVLLCFSSIILELKFGFCTELLKLVSLIRRSQEVM